MLEELTSVERLTRDLRASAATLSDEEARYLVDAYYIMQDQRIRTEGQVRSMSTSEEPHDVIQWLAKQSRLLEDQVKGALDRYTTAHPVGFWMKSSVKGIGPVIAAGLLAHIDITKAKTAGAIWRYAGLDPTSEWKKGEKRPWNADLKRLCWLLGESFVKTSGGDEPGYYGLIYKERKEQELAKNEADELADQAKAALEKKNYRGDTVAKKAYLEGKLPPAHIHRRATRYTVKRFLSDLHTVWHWVEYERLPPLPYVITHGGHAHYEASDAFASVPGLLEALRARGPMGDNRRQHEMRQARFGKPLQTDGEEPILEEVQPSPVEGPKRLSKRKPV